MPRPDFPKTIFEFQRQFPTEEAQLAFLIQSRWPDGFVCPRCSGKEYWWKATRELLQCKSCRYEASVTAGTVMHRSRVPIPLWLQAAYLVTTQTPGMSALQFQRQVGLKNYATAFAMLHKLRSAMVKPGRTKLNGIVEVDETFIGGERHGEGAGRGRGAANKVLVVGAVDLQGKYANRVRLKVIPNASSATLTAFIREHIEPGSTIKTDDWSGYSGLEGAGYKHIVTGEIPHIHRVFSNLKTWILGVAAHVP
ncbi:MAG: IS1595 family transposase [Chloroflexi bacterium]|nr:IS1595 family transposase [Chloroflexota bacterium]